jgi:cation diffusion facilitator CzcD-associated flavoprotein CzcO/acetyl esterase/lipase
VVVSGTDDRTGVDTVETRAARSTRRTVPHRRVAIVGSGSGGLGAAIRLRQSGVDDLVVFERGDDVGGTWRVNRYPGAACDIPSHLYEFAFAPNPDWTRRFAGQEEIWAYLRDCADRFDVRRHIRFGHDVLDATWDDAGRCWRITTSGGVWTADLLIAAAGALAEPKPPDVPGLDTFAGRVVHTARWDDAIDVSDANVAVVGTGASAVQVVPAIQPDAAHVTVFQRTPPWVVPRLDRPLRPGVRRLLRTAPVVRRALRRALYATHEIRGLAFRRPWIGAPLEALARVRLRRQVRDPALRRAVTPTYRIGCKRVLLADDWYPALQRPNVTLVGGALARVEPHSVTGTDGIARHADLLVLATGFRVTEPVFAERVHGRGGVRLADVWTPSMTAHLGTTVSRFPNLFVLLGPNTGLGHNSVVLMIEAQIDHVVNAVAAMDAHGATVIEPRPEAQRAFVDDVRDALASTVWTSGCDSWYLDSTGRNTTLWPRSVGAFRRRVAPFDPLEYHMTGSPVTASDATPSPVERARGAVARWLLPRVAGPLAARAGAVPATGDGVGLEPASSVVLAARPGGPSPLTRGTPAQARARYRCEVLSGIGRPTPVSEVAELTVEGAAGPLPARLYRTAAVDAGDRLPLLVYLHGGGFAVGDLDTHDEPCRLLCRAGDQHVLSVAYRLAPEHPFPAARDDVDAVVHWACEHADDLGGDGRVAVGGDSAGGNLAAVAARHSTHDGAPIAAQLLLYPATDRWHPWPSLQRDDGWFLTARDVERFGTWYGGRDRDPDVSPLRATDLGGLPPALTVTAGVDVLRDEGRAYAGALAAAGTPSYLLHASSLGHGFLHLTQVSPTAHRATVALARRWRRLLREGWPT